MAPQNKRRTLHIVFKFFLILLIPVIISYLFIHFFPIPAFSLNRDEIITYLLSFRQYALVIYLVLQTATVLIPPVPSVILATAAGVVFGFWKALPLTTIAWVIGTSINFFIARILGRHFLKKTLGPQQTETVDKFANNIGWKLIFLSWFIPGGTADLAGYAAGLTKMSYWRYLAPATASAFVLSIFTSAAGTAIGISPVLTAIFSIGAVLGIIFGVKLLVIFAFVKKGINYLKKQFFHSI
jgi:uncharacterized membrane protein YdjX (TVP38/TMEM64 family)